MLMLTCFVAQFDRGTESLEGGFICDGVGVRATDSTSRASSSGLENEAASLNLDVRR